MKNWRILRELIRKAKKYNVKVNLCIGDSSNCNVITFYENNLIIKRKITIYHWPKIAILGHKDKLFNDRRIDKVIINFCHELGHALHAERTKHYVGFYKVNKSVLWDELTASAYGIRQLKKLDYKKIPSVYRELRVCYNTYRMEAFGKLPLKAYHGVCYASHN
jgi:hypothetical protein